MSVFTLGAGSLSRGLRLMLAPYRLRRDVALMIKKTLLAASVTLALATAVPSAQAGTLSSMLGGLFDGHGVTTNFEARRGGFRSSRSARRSSTSSSRAVAPVNRSSSTSSNSTASNTSTNRNTTNNTNQQQDAQFSQNAYRGNNTTGTGTVGNNMATTRPGTTGYNQAGAAPGSMGMGSTFLSSLAGAGAGVLLANMLLSPSAAAAQGTEQATPEMLSDDQITECLDQLKLDLADAEARLADAADDEKAAIREEISQMHNLQISLMSEQLNRLKGTTEAAG